MNLDRPLSKALGPATAKGLAKLGLETIHDLLRHYPRRYEHVGQLTDFSGLGIGQNVTVLAQVSGFEARRMHNRPGHMVNVSVTDGHGTLALTFFARNPGIVRMWEKQLLPGTQGLFSGTVSEYRGQRQLVHPDYTLIGADDETGDAIEQAMRPIPIYAASASLPTWKIRRAVRTILDPLLEQDIDDPLPGELRERRNLPEVVAALHAIHTPENDEDWQQARERFRFEEAFTLQVALAGRRASYATMHGLAYERKAAGAREAFDAALPFTLTQGQLDVGEDIARDLAGPRPMQRLLQGDVGSGKTVVALRAMLQVIDAGGQAVLLAPTEVLAQQHFLSITTMLGSLRESALGARDGLFADAGPSVNVALLTGSMTQSEKNLATHGAANGEADLIIGTHALLSDSVAFAHLGLVVVDEQHRFGVEQRDRLRDRAATPPHLLVMTATPIPRTVAMTVFGDLDVSTLSQLPAGRQRTETFAVPAGNAAWMRRTWQRVAEEVAAGHRAIIVCPRISATQDEEGDLDGLDDEENFASEGATQGSMPDSTAGKTDGTGPGHAMADVETTIGRLRGLPVLAKVRFAALHGAMPADEKTATMAAFAAGEIDALVATTIIEVGIDVPEATCMVIMDADRFGLSQLHQMRGRVGRGAYPGVCLLVSSAAPESPAGQRLALMAETSDGFALAQADLAMRHEGDVLGAHQSGRSSSLRLLRVLDDADLIEEARAEADALVAKDPTLRKHPALAQALAEQLAEREDYLEKA